MLRDHVMGGCGRSNRALFTFKYKVVIVSNLNEVVYLCIKFSIITLALVYAGGLYLDRDRARYLYQIYDLAVDKIASRYIIYNLVIKTTVMLDNGGDTYVVILITPSARRTQNAH